MLALVWSDWIFGFVCGVASVLVALIAFAFRAYRKAQSSNFASLFKQNPN